MVDVETVMSGICDEFPHLRQRRFPVLLLVTTAFFLMGLPLCTQGGMHVLQLMDWYAAGACVLIIAIVECVVINWIYRNDRFASNMKEMLGKLPGKWWLICWKYISPLLLLGVLVFSFVEYKPATYGSYRYPAWADSLGWCMTMASVLPIIVVVIYKLVRSEGTTLREKWIKETTPLEDAMSKAEFIKNVKPDHNTKDVLVEDHVENHAEQADLADKIEEEDETAAQRRSLLKQQEANNSLETSAV